MKKGSSKNRRRGTSKKASSGKRAPSSTSSRPFWGSLLLSLASIGLLFGLAWVVYLDFQVREKFDGRKWKLPAQVYAQPLELFRDRLLRPEDLVAELRDLEYRQVASVTGAGQFSKRGDDFVISSRGFNIADDREFPLLFELSFRGNRVSRFRSLSGESLALARLEPVKIGGIYPRLQQDRELVRLQDVPQLLGEALIAVEDRRFVDHHGVSIKDIARAALANLQAGRIVQGGSTLTQQLVKNFYLDSGRRFTRKATEAVMALLLEWHYSKAEILETYINEVYLGQSGPRQIHGFALASQHYFQKPLQQLRSEEIALLVGLVKGASYYNPWRQPERALKRRNLVLDMLFQQQLISEAELTRAQKRPLGVVPLAKRRLYAFPAFVDLVKRQLLEEYSIEQLSSDGLKIYTTLSLSAQRAAERALAGQLQSIETARKIPDKTLQGAVVVTSVGSAEVEALVGDRQAHFAGFNRGLDARRSIGSLVKPAVYLSALMAPEGYHLASPIDDGPVTVEGPDGDLWRPQNFDRRSHGSVQLYDALVNSYNQATARLGMTLGLARVADTVKQLGVSARVPEVPSMLLGALEMSPLEVAAMYHSLANDGVHAPLRSIRSVVNAEGELLSRYRLASKAELDAEAVQLIQFAMQGVARDGTARSLYQTLPGDLNIAGKTGTSNDQRDSWFAGFSGDHVAVVWVGRDNNLETPLTGATGALRVWRQLFSQMPTRSLPVPQGHQLEYLWVDVKSGGLSGENCRDARVLPFLPHHRPDFRVQCEWRENPVVHWIKKWF